MINLFNFRPVYSKSLSGAFYLVAFLSSPMCFAETPFFVSLGGGQSFSTHTDSKSSGVGISGVISSDIDDSPSSYGEIEFGLRSLTQIVSIVYGTFEYKYKSGPPHDKMNQLFLLAKWSINLPDINSKLWAGFGGGVSFIKIGGTSGQSGSNTLTIQDASKTSLMAHGRVGIDHYFSGKWFGSIAFGFSYTTFSIVSNITTTSTGSFVGQLNTDLTRTWGTGLASLGFRF